MQSAPAWLQTCSIPSDFKKPCSLDRCRNLRQTARWGQTIVQSGCGVSCYTYIIVNITAEALTCSETIVSAGRLHTNYQKHRFSRCPRAIMHMSQVGSFRALWASAPLKWQLRWRGTNTKRRHRWQRTRKPLYLPCCHSMVHWGWNSMNNVCLAVHVENLQCTCDGCELHDVNKKQFIDFTCNL